MEIGKLAVVLLRLLPAFPSSWFRGFNLLSDFPSALLPPGTPSQPHGSILALFLLAVLTPEDLFRLVVKPSLKDFEHNLASM